MLCTSGAAADAAAMPSRKPRETEIGSQSTDDAARLPDTTEQKPVADAPMMVMVDNTLYQSTGEVSTIDKPAAATWTRSPRRRRTARTRPPRTASQLRHGLRLSAHRRPYQVLIDNQWTCSGRMPPYRGWSCGGWQAVSGDRNLPSEPFCGNAWTVRSPRNSKPKQTMLRPKTTSPISAITGILCSLDEDTIYVSATPDWMEFKVITDSMYKNFLFEALFCLTTTRSCFIINREQRSSSCEGGSDSSVLFLDKRRAICPMDEIDLEARLLQKNAHTPIKARQVRFASLPPPAVSARIERLENRYYSCVYARSGPAAA